MSIHHIKTDSGLEIDIDDICLDDMELMDDIADADRGKTIAISRVIRKLLGDQKEAFFNHLRTEDGRVPIQASMELILEVINKLGGKNS